MAMASSLHSAYNYYIEVAEYVDIIELKKKKEAENHSIEKDIEFFYSEYSFNFLQTK